MKISWFEMVYFMVYFMCIGRGGENETLTFKGAYHKNSKKEVISGITMITNLILK